MNRLVIVLCLFLGSLFIGCISDTEKASKNIDNVADELKGALDDLSDQAQKLLNEEEIDKVKKVIDDVALKSKDIHKDVAKDSTVWKEKLENIKNDKDIKELIDKHKDDALDIMKQIEGIFKEVTEKSKKEEA